MIVAVVVDFVHSIALQQYLGAAVNGRPSSTPIDVLLALVVTVVIALVHQVASPAATLRSGDERKSR